MIKSRHDTAFFQRSYSSGSSHGMTPNCCAKILSHAITLVCTASFRKLHLIRF
ncbi:MULTISPECIES: hypothetical protein [unclassified Rickettsia]|uniref:hypothetical protein n=1 Tax=unclassified Rickettsia TaxID=114295 RepID=UPI003132B106